MRISPQRFLRIGLLAIAAAFSYWICSTPVVTATRELPAADRPPMFVLQVGIGKYVHTPVWTELRGAVTDVVEMRKVLESDRYAVPATNIVTLTDSQGTKPLIFEKFRTHLIANARTHFEKTKNRDAVVMFQFSGHGSQVPDTDGDEKDDGKDETLVTHDSQDAPGKNYDITDDEIFALTSELRRYTDNIVYIFDSCHSGSGTRDAEDVRRLPERKTVPLVVDGVGAATTRAGTMKPDDSDSGVLPPGDDYIVITAARSGELASQKNCFEECGATTRPVVYGNLTYYLIDELKNARADTSYRELMENVTRRVTSEKPTQTPQLEGDRSRMVFGSLGRNEDNFTRIVEAEKKIAAGRTVKIGAGAMQGVAAGTIISFYDKSVTWFDHSEKISSGRVTAVAAAESTVLLIDPKREITGDDKAVVIAADLGATRLKVNLDADAAKLNAGQKNAITTIRGYLAPPTGETQEPRGVDVVTPQFAAAGRWDVAVLKDKFSAVAAKIGKDAKCEGAAAGPDSDVFYIAGRDYVPLYGFCLAANVEAADQQTAAASRIEAALVHLARLKSVNAIANKRTMLRGKVTVRPIRLNAPFGCENSRFTSGSQDVLAANPKSGMFPIAAGEAFWFEVTNNSPKDLYVVLLNMPPDGSVKLWSPRSVIEEENGVLIPKNGGKRILMSEACRVDSAGNFLEVGAFRASKPLGADRYKFIVGVQPMLRKQFAFLEMAELKAKRAETGSLAGQSDWTTIETILDVTDTGS